MAILKAKIKASTLMEVIIASLIMLIVFSLSMDVMSKIFISMHSDNSSIEIENEMNQQISYYSNGYKTIGTYEHIYKWGCITVTINEYDKSLLLLTVTAKSTASKQSTFYNTLIKKSIDREN